MLECYVNAKLRFFLFVGKIKWSFAARSSFNKEDGVGNVLVINWCTTCLK